MASNQGTDIRTITGALGFDSYLDIRSRISVADLFKPKRRCGLYALYFANGEGYIGRTVDVARRFCGHRLNHEDIAEIAFRPLRESDQDREERIAIGVCEAARVRLRNIQFVSVVVGETDLDMIFPVDQQIQWLQSDKRASSLLRRPNDEDLRRRYQKRFNALEARRQWPILQPVLREYLATCIPTPDQTELSFWSISCLSGQLYNRGRLLARLNLNWQEVMSVGMDAASGSIWITFHVRRSILEARKFIVPKFASLVDHHYAPGGSDQVKIWANEMSPGDILSIIQDDAFRAAAKDFNLNLMRKGANNFARFHCFALADAIMKPEHVPFRPAGRRTTPSSAGRSKITSV